MSFNLLNLEISVTIPVTRPRLLLPIQYREHHLPPFEVSEGPTLGGFKDKILIEERNLIQHGLYQ